MSMEALSTLGRPALVNCEHCGAVRMRMTMTDLRYELLARPTPLLLRITKQLRNIYGGHATIYVCTACSCVTGDLTKHTH